MTTIRILLAGGLFLACSPAYGQEPEPAPQPDQSSPRVVAPIEVSGGTRVRLGGISLGAGYSRLSRRPLYYPGFYRPIYSPYYPHHFSSGHLFYPPYGALLNYRADTGEVRLSTNIDDAQVFIDGGLAGEAKDLKKFWLDPGAYDLKIEHPDYQTLSLRLYVLSGKKLKINGELKSLGSNP